MTGKDFDNALRSLTANPVAELILRGEANIGDVLEAAGAIVAVACGEARSKRDASLSQQAKSAHKLWHKFQETFHVMALRARELTP